MLCVHTGLNGCLTEDIPPLESVKVWRHPPPPICSTSSQHQVMIITLSKYNKPCARASEVEIHDTYACSGQMLALNKDNVQTLSENIAHTHSFTLLYEHFTFFMVFNSYNFTVMMFHSKCMPQNEFLIARKQVNMAFVQLVNCPVTVQESGRLVLIFHPR